ncbi:hypothetical protein RN607_01690 [Demequina capsici]|uniref:Oxidase n=1 Tax=Demequina capsici TaxID=3075620 RepID=A0AA96FE63_9MICO|nr:MULTISPECIES: hypothetical protein [unclassified Demequina]WNM24835.1 hypothetical protein RN606_01415 [Demequina sp. OYTSA14]WNM27742.1 hypothetical protein RN607_01690 [Demequina sp. PMTSA13]
MGRWLREPGVIEDRTLVRAIVMVGIAAITMLIGGLLLAVLEGFSPASALRDPLATHELGRSVGLLSIVGVVLWVSGGVMYLFAATLVPARSDRLFLCLAGAVCLFLALDDQFMLHEIPSDKLPAGDLIVAAYYGGAFIVIAWVMRTWVRDRIAIVLAIALALLGASLSFDVIRGAEGTALGAVLEDTFKFLGIAYFTAYAALKSYDLVAAARPVSARVKDGVRSE